MTFKPYSTDDGQDKYGDAQDHFDDTIPRPDVNRSPADRPKSARSRNPLSQTVAHPFCAKIVVTRTTIEKSPASRDRDAETADFGPDWGVAGAEDVIAVSEGQKRGSAYSQAAVRAIGLGGYDNALLAEGVSSKDVRPARRSLGGGGWSRRESNSRPRDDRGKQPCVCRGALVPTGSGAANARLRWSTPTPSSHSGPRSGAPTRRRCRWGRPRPPSRGRRRRRSGASSRFPGGRGRRGAR